MPTIGYTEVCSGPKGKVIKWSGLAHGDDGTPYILPYKTDRSVQVYGTFGAAGTATIQGSNDVSGSITYATLNDPQGNALTITAAKIEQILECSLQVRPVVTGDATTALTVLLMLTSE